MAGTKISQLAPASNVIASDVLYLVNNGNPRKITLENLFTFLKSHTEVIVTLNGHGASNNALTLTKADIILDQVPNVSPVTTLNGANGAVNILGASNQLSITNVGKNITVGVANTFNLDFSKVSGNWQDNPSLSTALSNLGAQTLPRTLNSSSSSLDLIIEDTISLWVEADFTGTTNLTLPSLNASIGAMIEVRQKGLGVIGILSGDAYTFINTPYGTWDVTRGVGTRIQLVHLGDNVWEFK